MICDKTAAFDCYSSGNPCSRTDPAAQRALHQEVFVSGMELRGPRRLEVRLQKTLAERGHWEGATNYVNLNYSD